MSVRKRKWKTANGDEREAWVVRYADQQGKWRLKTFGTKKEADDWRVTALHEVKQGTHTPARDMKANCPTGSIDLCGFLNRWSGVQIPHPAPQNQGLMKMREVFRVPSCCISSLCVSALPSGSPYLHGTRMEHGPDKLL